VVRPTTGRASAAPIAAPTPLRAVQSPFTTLNVLAGVEAGAVEQLASCSGAGARRSGKRPPELWRAFEQNGGGRPPLRRRRMAAARVPRNSSAADAPAALVPRLRPANLRPRAQSSDALPPNNIAIPARRLAPISRSGLPRGATPQANPRKRKATEVEAEGSEALKATSSPKNVPMCLCCGGLLDEVPGPSREKRLESLLLKCNTCGLTSRVASVRA
jgi:hypothetical protein